MDSTQNTRTSLLRSRAFYLTLAALFAAVLLYFSLRGIDWSQVWLTLSHADLKYLLVWFAIVTVALVLRALRWRVLFKHDWFWREIFDSLSEPNTPYINQAEARLLITKGQAAISSGNGEGLRDVVRGLWKLQPKGVSEEARERAVRSGLRKF